MKNIKYIIYSFLLVASFSCTVELDDEVVIQSTTALADATLTMDGDQFGPGIPVPFSFTLPQSFDKKATITVRAISKELIETTATVTVNPGATTGAGSITLPATSGVLPAYSQTMDFATIKITGIALNDEVDDNGTNVLVNAEDDNFTLTSNEISLSYYAMLPAQSGAGSFSYLLDWEDPVTFDIDLQVIDAAFTAIFESSASGDRYESDFFDNSHPDGDYDFYFRIYTADNPTTVDINYTLFTVQPDGTRNIYQGVIPAGTAAGGARIDFATLTALGDDFTFVID